jgi:hypothetical protein
MEKVPACASTCGWVVIQPFGSESKYVILRNKDWEVDLWLTYVDEEIIARLYSGGIEKQYIHFPIIIFNHSDVKNKYEIWSQREFEEFFIRNNLPVPFIIFPPKLIF